MLVNRHPDESETCDYAALYDVGQPPELIAFSLIPASTFGAWWEIAAVNENGQIIRRGRMHCQMGETPYCLLEVNTENVALSPDYREHWILAVGLLDEDARKHFSKTEPFHLYAGGMPTESDMNNVDVEPVRWDSDGFSVGILDEASAECRPAESVMSRLMPSAQLATPHDRR